MSFFLRGSWVCGFREPDLKTFIGRIRVFGSAEALRELVRRTATKMLRKNQQAFDYGIEQGRDGVWLQLTAEQYAALKR